MQQPVAVVQFSKVVDVPVIMRVEVPQIQSIADVVDISACNRDRSRLLAVMAAMKGWWAWE